MYIFRCFVPGTQGSKAVLYTYFVISHAGIQNHEIEISESGSEAEQLDIIDSSFVLPYVHTTLILILYTGELPARLDHLRHHCRHPQVPPRKTL